MKIKYKYKNESAKLSFCWEKNKKEETCKEIFLKEDKEQDLNNLYDYIINNVDQIEFIDETNANDKNDSVTYKAFQAIIESLKKEHKTIKEEYDEINDMDK